MGAGNGGHERHSGAAGSAIIKMLLNVGVKDIIVCSSKGILSKDEPYSNWVHQEIAEMTNKDHKRDPCRCHQRC